MSSPSEPQLRDPLLATLGGDRCPACGAPVEPRIALGDYDLFRCGECESWCSDARVRGASTTFSPDAYFDNAEDDRDKWETLVERLGKVTLTSLLEVGCGNGAFLGFMGSTHPKLRLVGIELDPERAERARRANPGADVHTGSVQETLARICDRFDLITLWDVLEHLPEPGSVLEGLARRLSPGGRIYIQTIHEHSWVPALGRLSYSVSGGRLQYLARRTHEAHHVVFFSRDGLSRLASRAGLRIREIWFDRLAPARMDGNRLLTASTSALLRIENALGNGLFVSLILEAD